MKSKKVKTAAKCSPRTSEEDLLAANANRNAFSFLKNRFFTATTNATTNQQSNNGPRPSTSSNRSTSKPRSIDTKNDVKAEKPISKSFDEHSISEFNTSSSTTTSFASHSKAQKRNTRPMSMMGLDSLTNNPADKDASIVVRRNQSVMTTDNIRMSAEKRASLTTLKEGYLFKKTDFKPFHKQSKLDRGWKLYRVVLKGHKLYLYKLTSESPLRSLFPSNHQLRQLPISLTSISNSSTSSSMHTSPIQLSPGMTTVTTTPVHITKLEKSDFDRDAQQLFFHTLPTTAQGAIFMELDPVTLQPNKQMYLILFKDMLYILGRTDTTSSLWKIEKKFALEQIHVDHCNKPLIETPTSPASISSMQSETIHDWSFSQMFLFSVYSANQLIGVFSTQNRDLGQTWINAFNTNMALLYDATQKPHPEIVLGCDRNHRTVVKGGTVHALVHQLLNNSTGQDYILVFLLTYATFTTGASILAQIKETLKVDVDAKLSLAVLDIFDIWCKQYPLDVMGDIATGMVEILDNIDTERARQVKELVLCTVDNNTKKTCEQTNKTNISSMSSALAPADNMPEEEDQVENITAYEENGKHRNSINLSNLLITGLTPTVFLMIDPTSFAHQIYLFHFSKHQQFKHDLLNPLSYLPRPQVSVQLFNSLLFTTAAPHFLTKLIRNHILIDTQQQSEQDQIDDCLLLRSRLLSHWIRIGAQLLDMGEMTGWSAIAMGICSVGIVRLRETWKAVDRTLVYQVQTIWVDILVDYGLFTQTMWFDQMPAMTKVLDIHGLNNCTQGPSGLPFFGTIRQSVDRLRKHSNKLLIPNIINFEECQSIYDVITSSLDQYKVYTATDAPSHLPIAVNPLQSFFEHAVTDLMSVPHDYKYLQECSLACEPRIFGQGFDRRKFTGHQNNTTISPASTTNSDVAPPSINSLIFPAILDSCSLLETPQDGQQQQHGETGKMNSRKLGTNNSFRSLRSLLDDTSTNKKTKPYYSSSSGQEVISPPRAANRKSFRRRTYSFPPGNNGSTVTNNNHNGNSPKSSSRHDLSLEAENSRTWLGSLISSKYNRTYSTKALIEAHRKNRVAQYGQNGEILLNTQHGELVFNATALLRKEEKDDDDDEEEGLLVTIKAGYLEQLIDLLVCGIAPYEHALKDQWQILSLTERLEQPTKIVMDLEEYIHVFFMTFRIYCSSTHLLDMLRKRFIEAKFKCKLSAKKKNSLILLESYFNPTIHNNKLDPSNTDDPSDDGLTAYDWKKVAEIQLAVLDLLLFWTDEHPYDFIEEIEATRYICNFLKNAKESLQSWRAPLIINQQSENNEEALHLATLIDRRLTQLYQQFIFKSICPNYDMKALSFDPSISGGTESLYCQLTSSSQRFHTTLQLVAGHNPIPLSISSRPRSADTKGLIDTFAPEPLLEHVDRTIRQLFYAVTLQDWIQTFDVFEAQSSDLYAWLPARKASRTSRMATSLAPVVDAPLTHVADYHVSPDEVVISDIFTMIEGARRSMVSPSAFSDDDLLLALPGSVQHLYCMHFIVRSWVINEITALDIELKTRVLRIERFLQMVVRSKSCSEKLALFPDLSVHGRVPGFVEYAIASALVSPEVRIFSKAWNDVAAQHGHVNLDTLEHLLAHMEKTRPNPSPSSSTSHLTRTFSASSTISASQPQQQQQLLVPSLGWVFERIMELCFHVPDTFENKDNLINFDKRRCVYQFLKLMLNIQSDLDEHQQSEYKGISMSFLLTPNQSKYTWKDLKELSLRESKKPTSNGSSSSLGLRGSTTKSYNPKYTVFNKLVTEQLEKLKRDMKERDRIDKEWLNLQHKLQKKQLEQARLVEKQDRKAGISNHNTKQPLQQPLQQQQQQQHVMPRLNSFLRGLRTQSMVASPLQHIFPVNHSFDAQQPHLATTKASTVINLIHVTTSVASTYTKRDHVFRIVTEEGGQYLFQGMNRQDMLDWMHVINSSAREGAAKRQSVLAAESSVSSTISMDHHHSAAPSFNQRNQPASRASVYGVPLDNLMIDGQVPLVVDKCIREIERRGLEEVGIYRVAGTGSVVSALKQAFNRDVSRVDLSNPDWADINVVADAFKQFLRELPEPLLTYTYYDEFINASASEDHDERVYLIKKVIKKLPPSNYVLLKRIIEHFVIVTDFEAINHMYATNLAIVFGPTLLQPTPGPASFATTMSNLGHHQNIVKYLILNYHYLFDVESDETDPLCCKEDEAIEATATPVTTSEAENKAMPTDM